MYNIFTADMNYWAILVSAASSMALGFLWYGPLFSKPWSRAMGIDMENKDQSAQMQKESAPMYVVMFIGSLVSALALSYFIYYAIAITSLLGAMVGLMVGVGFITPAFLGNTMFGRRPKLLFYIDTGYWLVNLVIMGAIIGAWR